jgi:tetratricopeptide (TPR) repeat protein
VGLLAAGDQEAAAEAALMLADVAWNKGRRARLIEHLDDARSLVADAPPSRVQATVLTEVARFEMLADRNDSAIEVGHAALRMAEELGLDDLRGSALNNIGAARVAAGDPGGLDDLEKSVVLAERGRSIPELIRARNNLGVLNLLLGHAERARAEVRESHRLAVHFGHHGFARWAEGGPVLAEAYVSGSWDEALELAEKSLAGDTGHYQAAGACIFRGLIRMSRADPEGAESDAERSVELARPAMDPQLVLTTSAMAALIFLSGGNEARARETLEEALAGVRELRQIGFAAVEAHALAWVAWALGRPEDFLEVVRNEPSETPWLQAARAVAAGDFRQAADIFAGIEAPTKEAFYRLRAAEQLVAEGRRAEADEQLRPALAFYRSVGATRYVREGEALLAASA